MAERNGIVRHRRHTKRSPQLFGREVGGPTTPFRDAGPDIFSDQMDHYWVSGLFPQLTSFWNLKWWEGPALRIRTLKHIGFGSGPDPS